MRGDLVWAYVAPVIIAALMAAASIVGLVYRSSLYPTEGLLRSFVPNDVVTLCIGLPILVGSVWLARRGGQIGLLSWPGAMLFVLYTSIVYVAAMPLNVLFMLHLALVTLSAYTLIGLVASIDGNAVQRRLAAAVPTRVPAGILVGLGLLFLIRALVVIVSALGSQTTLADTDLAVSISDFLITPSWVIGGVLLWRRMELGYVTGEARVPDEGAVGRPRRCLVALP